MDDEIIEKVKKIIEESEPGTTVKDVTRPKKEEEEPPNPIVQYSIQSVGHDWIGGSFNRPRMDFVTV